MRNPKLLELRASVIGRVQGVGFRAKTKELAMQMHLGGFVRNLKDASVEIHAQGTKEQLTQFLEQLKQRFSDHIQELKIEWIEPSEVYAHFTISRMDG